MQGCSGDRAREGISSCFLTNLDGSERLDLGPAPRIKALKASSVSISGGIGAAPRGPDTGQSTQCSDLVLPHSSNASARLGRDPPDDQSEGQRRGGG